MLAKRIIPCLDVDRGRVVKGMRFVSLVDAGDPVEQAQRYDAAVGGGLRTVEDLRAVLRSGADKVSLNTSAVETPELISEGAGIFGAQCMVVSIDARRRNSSQPAAGWEVYTHGGRHNVGWDAVEWAQRAERLGAGEILLTIMDRDGTRRGYDLELTRTIADAVRIPV